MRVSRQTTACGAAVLALAMTSASCSSSPDPAVVQQQFLTVVKNTDQALARDRSVKHPDQSYGKYSVDFHNAAVQFRAITFPSNVQHQARALIASLDLISADAAKVAKAVAKPQTVLANVQAFARANLTLMEDEKTERTNSATLRHALGLPPEPTTTTTAPSPAPTPLTSQPPAATTTTTAH